MIARVWRGVVPIQKADDYGHYLADSERGVRDYQRVPGNRGVCLLRRVEGYTGPDIEHARYFPYDRERLLDPDPTVAHYDVLVAPGTGAV